LTAARTPAKTRRTPTTIRTSIAPASARSTTARTRILPSSSSEPARPEAQKKDSPGEDGENERVLLTKIIHPDVRPSV
jgi:hypothetical protein